MKVSHFLYKTHLEKGEHIKFVAHSHVFTIWKEMLKILGAGLILPAAFFYLFPPLRYLWIAWFIGGIIKYIYELADWYFDAWLITNIGVIDIEWNGFFHKSSARIEYQTVKGITYTITGFWGTILSYGDIVLEAYGGNTVYKLVNASHPKKIERIILSAQDKFVSNKTFSEHESLKVLLTTLLEKTTNGK